MPTLDRPCQERGKHLHGIVCPARGGGQRVAPVDDLGPHGRILKHRERCLAPLRLNRGQLVAPLQPRAVCHALPLRRCAPLRSHVGNRVRLGDAPAGAGLCQALKRGVVDHRTRAADLFQNAGAASPGIDVVKHRLSRPLDRDPIEPLHRRSCHSSNASLGAATGDGDKRIVPSGASSIAAGPVLGSSPTSRAASTASRICCRVG